jgi:hypothetical protein
VCLSIPENTIKIDQGGEPSVSLSFDLGCEEASGGAGFVAVNLPVKVEDRVEEDGPMIAQVCLSGGEQLTGKAIEKRSSAGWLVYRIPRDLCPEGGSLTFRALVDEVVLWQREYRVVWRGRFPGLKSTV